MTIRATSLVLLLSAAALLSQRSGGASVDAGPAPVVPGGAALRFLEARVEQDPLDFLARNRLASSYLSAARSSGDTSYLARAEREARQSLAAVPAEQNPAALVALARTQLAQHRFADSARSAESAVRVDPGSINAIATLGDAQLELGNYDDAERIYRSLAERGEAAPILGRQARLSELRGNDDAALELLERAAASDQAAGGDDAGWYRIRRGEILFRSGKLDEAEAEYNKAPDSPVRRERLGELRAAQGRTDEAIAIFEALVASAPRAEWMHALGDLYKFAGRSVEATGWHDRAAAAYLASVEAGNVHDFHHLAAFYSDSRPDPDKALYWARRDLELRRSVHAWDAVAWALYRNRDFPAAADAMTKALSLGTRDPHLFEHAGLIFWSSGELDKARGYLQVAAARQGSFHLHR